MRGGGGGGGGGSQKSGKSHNFAYQGEMAMGRGSTAWFNLTPGLMPFENN